MPDSSTNVRKHPDSKQSRGRKPEAKTNMIMKSQRPKQNSTQRGNPALELIDMITPANERRTDAHAALARMKRLEAERRGEMVSVRIPGPGNTLMLATPGRAAEICEKLPGASIESSNP